MIHPRYCLTKNQKIALIVSAIVLISAVAAYFLYRNRKKEARIIAFPPLREAADGQDDGRNSDRRPGNRNPVEESSDRSPHDRNPNEEADEENIIPIQPESPFPLKLGSQGKEVEQLQIYLMKNSGGFDANQLDGFFGHYTLEKLKKHCHRDQMSERNFYKRKINKERTYKYQLSC